MTERDKRSTRTWAGDLPEDRAWKGRKGRTRRALAAEQDRAAGGVGRRWIDVGNGCQAHASVELKLLPHTRRIRAYLRWSDHGRSPSRYLGEVRHATRAENLAEGWRIAREKGLLATRESPAASWAATSAVRSSMQGNRSKDTTPERRLRSILHKLGLRYRINTRPLTGVRRTADIVFSSVKIAVFVDGCYWHGCPQHYRPSRANQEFWQTKIAGNKARDLETSKLLSDAGWTSIRVWEHEDPALAAAFIAEAVSAARRPVGIAISDQTSLPNRP